MKTRSGFVSNSSSSSFIVAFDKVPTSPEELKTLLFDNAEVYYHPYDDQQYTTQQVAETVFNDLTKTSPLKPEEVLENIKYGTFDGCPNFDYNSWKDNLEGFKIACHEAAKIVSNEFIQKNAGKILYKFHYSDNDGSYGSALEHGDLFQKLPHITVSHH